MRDNFEDEYEKARLNGSPELSLQLITHSLEELGLYKKKPPLPSILASEEYNTTFDQQIEPVIEGARAERSKVEQELKPLVTWRIFIYLFDVILVLGFLMELTICLPLMLFSFPLTLFIASKIRIKRNNLNNQVADSIINKTIQCIDPSFKFYYSLGLKEEAIRNAYILPIRFDDYTTLSAVKGTYKGVPFEFARVELLKIQGNSKKGRRVTAVFQGVVFILYVRGKYKAVTKIYPSNDKEKDDLCERVLLEDPTFESHYQVFGEDQIEARKILTPRFIEKMLKYQDEKKLKPSMAYTPMQIYFAIDEFPDLPVIDITESNKKLKQDLGHYHAYVSSIKDVIDFLELGI